jgi:hypothetical protein
VLTWDVTWFSLSRSERRSSWARATHASPEEMFCEGREGSFQSTTKRVLRQKIRI